jgi:HAD superfamily hydrolase (TIGR01509 family)
MKLDHIGIEVGDLFAMELFYRKALGFSPRYRYVSRNTPGLRTVFLEKDGLFLELLERSRDQSFLSRGRLAPNHISLGVEDVDGAYARIASLRFPRAAIQPPRDTGDGFREAELRDPEGNVVELSARVRPEPHYPVRAVIFDLDGTLVDSEENYYLADKKLLERHQVPFTREDKKRYIGGGNRDMMVDLKRRFDLPESTDELVEIKNRLYLEIAETSTRLYPKMKVFFDLLRARKVPVAVASGSSPPVLERVLAAVGLAKAFEVVVSAEEVSLGKPAPDIFVETARRLGVPAHECVVVEDSQYGVEAAKRAFTRCIAVPYLTEKPLADSFLMADLLFEGGMEEFDAAEAYRWVGGLLAE